MEEEAGEVPGEAGEEGGEEAEGASVAGHGEAEEKDAGDGITGEVADIAVQPDGGGEAEPLAVGDRVAIEDTAVREAWEGEGGEVMHAAEERGPEEGSSVPGEPRLGQGSSPIPAAVLDAVLADGVEGALVVRGADEQAPGRGIGGVFDGGIDALAGEDEAPVHGLSMGAGGDDRDRGGIGWSEVARMHCARPR